MCSDPQVGQHRVLDLAIRANQVRAPAHPESEWTVHVVGLDRLLLRVGEQREIEVVPGRELLVRVEDGLGGVDEIPMSALVGDVDELLHGRTL